MKNRRVSVRSQRLTVAKLTPPDWFGWLGCLAMLLVPVVRIDTTGGVWFSPLLSLGEWLMLPLGVCSITMGFLSLSRIREKTLLPLWISAIVPAVLWIAAMGLAMVRSGFTSDCIDMILAWAVHLIFPTMVFLPLFAMRVWRNRLMWALVLGLILNAVMVFWQGKTAGIAPPNQAALALGGFLASQHDFGLMLGVALPLLAAWRGGHEKKNAFAILLCTFLLPMLVLAACFTASGYIAALGGLIVAWAAWRGQAWVMGIFLILVVLGYGAESSDIHDRNQRKLLTDSASLTGATYRRALNVFQVRPYLGSGPAAFCRTVGQEPTGSIVSTPWYGSLLGGSGLMGLGMWAVLLGEIAARTMGRVNRRCLWHGGVLGGVVAVLLAGFWTDALPEGAGAMIGLLIALSILEEPENAPPPRRGGRKGRNDPLPEPTPVMGALPPLPPKTQGKSGDTDIIARP